MRITEITSDNIYGFKLDKINKGNLIDLIEALFDSGGDPKIVLDQFEVPPWIRVVIPSPPNDAKLRRVWKQNLSNVLNEITSLEKRKGYAKQYLESFLRHLQTYLIGNGYSRAMAEQKIEEIRNNYIYKIDRVKTLEELIKIEKELSKHDVKDFTVSVSSIGNPIHV